MHDAFRAEKMAIRSFPMSIRSWADHQSFSDVAVLRGNDRWPLEAAVVEFSNKDCLLSNILFLGCMPSRTSVRDGRNVRNKRPVRSTSGLTKLSV